MYSNMSVIHQLNTLLYDRIPLFILINFILFVVLIVFNWVYIKKFLLKVDGKTWFILVLIFFAALLVRVFVPPHQHVIYVDEPWYMEAGKDMLQTGYQGYYPKSIGWPFILSIAFGIFGISNWVAIYTSTFLGALTVFNVFFLTFVITKYKSISLASSLVFSLFATHIRRSASAETNVASLFFILLTLFFCFLYYRNRKTSLLWLSLISLAFTAQFGPENYVFPVLFLFGCVLFDKKFFKNINIKFILPWLVLIILSFANLTQILDHYTSTNWAELADDGVTDKNFGFHNFTYNTLMYGKYLFNTRFQPLLFTALFIIGLFYMFYKQKKEFLFLIGWFCFLWFVYAFSYFSSIGLTTHVSAKTKFFMNFYPITVIFMGYGILLIRNVMPDKIKKIRVKEYIFPLLTLITSFLFISYLLQAGSMFSGSSHKLETKIPELAEKDIPEDCVIIANWPTVLKSTTNLNVIDIKDFLDQEALQKEVFNNSSCVLFFEDIYCFEGLGNLQAKENCKKIKEVYDLKEYKSYSEEDKKYTFYKINI